MITSGCVLDVVKDCEECVKEFSFVTVWKLKSGGYAICTLNKNNQYVIYSLDKQIEFAINNALWLDSIL